MKAFVLLSLALLPLLLQPSQPTAAPKQLFFDDFAAPIWTDPIWNAVVTGRTVNNEQQAYIDSPDVFTFPRRYIRRCDERRARDTAPLPRRFHDAAGPAFRFRLRPRRLEREVRVHAWHGVGSPQAPRRRGPVAGLWILGTGQWPATGEIDVMEYVRRA